MLENQFKVVFFNLNAFRLEYHFRDNPTVFIRFSCLRWHTKIETYKNHAMETKNIHKNNSFLPKERVLRADFLFVEHHQLEHIFLFVEHIINMVAGVESLIGEGPIGRK